jgi:hypothetical protein
MCALTREKPPLGFWGWRAVNAGLPRPPWLAARRWPSASRATRRSISSVESDQIADLPGRRPTALGPGNAVDRVPSRGPLRRTAADGGRAARSGPASPSRQRGLRPQGRDATGASGTVRRRSPQRRGPVAHVRRRGRGRPDRSPGDRAWTAHGFLLVALDRPDVFLPGDLALRRAIERLYGFDHLPTEEEMVQLAERWRPYRSLAVS